MDNIKIYWVDEMNLHEVPGESNRDIAVVYAAKAKTEIARLQTELEEIKTAMKGNCADIIQVED